MGQRPGHLLLLRLTFEFRWEEEPDDQAPEALGPNRR